MKMEELYRKGFNSSSKNSTKRRNRTLDCKTKYLLWKANLTVNKTIKWINYKTCIVTGNKNMKQCVSSTKKDWI